MHDSFFRDTPISIFSIIFFVIRFFPVVVRCVIQPRIQSVIKKNWQSERARVVPEEVSEEGATEKAKEKKMTFLVLESDSRGRGNSHSAF